MVHLLAAVVHLFARAFHNWIARIKQQQTLRGKIIVTCIGLIVISCFCSIPGALVNGSRRSATAVALVPSVRPTTVEADVPTIEPSSMAVPSPTTEPVTATSAPTVAPTDTPTAEPSVTPVPTAKPKPTTRPAPKPFAAPATSRLNTHGANLDNCGDFANYAEAYAVYKANLPGDPNDLDRDRDGIPCESLPGAP